MVPEDEKNLNSKDQGIEKVIEGIKSSNNRIEEIRARIDADIKARKQQLENEAKAVEEAKKEPEQIDLLSTETAEEEVPEIEVPEVGVEKTEEVLAEEAPVLEAKDETPAEEKAEALADAEVKETEGSTAEKPEEKDMKKDKKEKIVRKKEERDNVVKIKKVKEKKTTEKVARPKAAPRTKLMFIIGLVIVAIPFVLLAIILLSDYFSGNKPIYGDRYSEDLDPAITTAMVSETATDMQGLSGVESAKAELTTSTLRVYLDTTDSYNEENLLELAKTAYQKIDQSLGIKTYFTTSSTKKMYDLELHLFNTADTSAENFAYVILTRNSNSHEEEGYDLQAVTIANDPELAEALRQAVENRN